MYRKETYVAVAVAALAGVMLGKTAEAHPPPFYWMPDLSGHSRAGVEVIPGNLEHTGSSAFLVDGSVFAELALSHHLSLVGRVPFAYVDRAGAGGDEPAWALGNVGLGLQIAGASGRAHARTRYGIGVLAYVPTASDEGDGLDAATRAASFLVPDAGRYLPDATTVRLRGDLRYEGDAVFLQGELALDHRLRDQSEDRTDLLVGLGLGLAFNPYLAMLAELTVVSDVLESDGDDSLSPVLDVGLRYHNPQVMAGLRLFLPLHEAYRTANAIGIGVDLAARF